MVWRRNPKKLQGGSGNGGGHEQDLERGAHVPDEADGEGDAMSRAVQQKQGDAKAKAKGEAPEERHHKSRTVVCGGDGSAVGDKETSGMSKESGRKLAEPTADVGVYE